METDKLIEALVGCMDRNDCRKCPILGQCNGTFDSAIHVTVEHIKTQSTEITTLRAQLAEKDKQLSNARNELCQQCGKYRMAHKGACDGCRWKEMTM